MPKTSEAVSPAGIKIVFNEDDHSYVTVSGSKKVIYTSATTFISSFFTKFDPTGAIAERKAKELGCTKEEIQARWKAKGDKSCKFGTHVHEVCEDIILGHAVRNSPLDAKEAATFKIASAIAMKFRTELSIFGVEKLVFCPNLVIPLAGTIDLLAQSKKDGTYLILDWKTNEQIEVGNKYKKFGLDPIRHVPDTNFYHYALQLSCYEFLLKIGGYVKPDAKFKRALIHLKEDSSKIYQLPDMSNEIRDMLLWKPI